MEILFERTKESSSVLGGIQKAVVRSNSRLFWMIAEAKENLVKLMAEAQEKLSQGKLVELVVDGPSLNQILGKVDH